jgi:hypothetical protein
MCASSHCAATGIRDHPCPKILADLESALANYLVDRLASARL